MYFETPGLILGVNKHSHLWPKPLLLMHAIGLSEMTELWRGKATTWSTCEKHGPGAAELRADVTRRLQLSSPPFGDLNENGLLWAHGKWSYLKS